MSSACTLWMGDIESWMDEVYISGVYRELGKDLLIVGVQVNSVKIMKDKISGIKLGIVTTYEGYCFVEFSTQDQAKTVLEQLNGKNIGLTNK